MGFCGLLQNIVADASADYSARFLRRHGELHGIVDHLKQLLAKTDCLVHSAPKQYPMEVADELPIVKTDSWKFKLKICSLELSNASTTLPRCSWNHSDASSRSTSPAKSV